LRPRKFEFQHFCNSKKYEDIKNVVLYQCINFQDEICCSLILEKIINCIFTMMNSALKKSIFFCENLLFLLSQKYNVFHFQKLHFDRVQD
jgi:hypothetical protein